MDRRASPRYEIEVEVHANLVCKALGRRQCIVRDFSEGGALLEVPDLHEHPPGAAYSGDVVLLHLRLPVPEGERVFEIRGVLCHLEAEMVGFRFHHIQPDVLAGLRQLSGLPLEHKEVPAAARQIVSACSELLTDFLVKGMVECCQRAEGRLFDAADRARSDSEQRTFFEAYRQFKVEQGAICAHYARLLQSCFARFAPLPAEEATEPSATSQPKLTLVDKEQFEDWLVVKVLATKYESRCREQLFELQLRLDELFGTELGKQFNPYVPAVLCEAFKRAVREQKFPAESERLIFDAFELTVLTGLERQYERLNELLIQRGILPELDLSRHIKKEESRGGRRGQGLSFAGQTSHKPGYIVTGLEPPPNEYRETEVLDGPSGEGIAVASTALPRVAAVAAVPELVPVAGDRAVAAAGGALGAAEAYAVSPLPPDIHPGMFHHAEDLIAFVGENSAVPQERFAVQQQIARQAFTTAMKLVELQHARERVHDLSRQAADEATPLPTEELLQALAGLQHRDVAEQRSLLERVNSLGELQQMALHEHDRAACEMVDSLFSTMLSNDKLSDQVKAWIRQLEAPMLRQVLRDESVFTSESHPVRQLLNQLTRIGHKDQVVTVDQQRKIGQAIAQIAQDFDGDVSLFQQALPEVEAVAQRQEQVFQRNVERVAQLAEGEQKLEMAKRRVDEELNQRMAGKRVPKAVMSLLEAGWRDLLVMSHIRHGEGASWRENLGVIDQLLAVGDAPSAMVDLRTLLRTIKTGLEMTSGGIAPDHQQHAVADLRQLFTDRKAGAGQVLEMVQVPLPTPVEVKEDDASLRKWIERAKRLEVGDWLELMRDAGAGERMRLAWIARDHGRFVLVNHQGMKVSDFTLEQLACLLRDGKATIVVAGELPLVDEALDKMVERIYDQLAWQTTHDELTGLINRKEFERAVGEALERSRRIRSHHVLCHLDLDQFSLINNTAGYDAGDNVLRKVAGLLQEPMSCKVVAARLGGDEFGVLLMDCDFNDGQLLVQSLLRTIANTRHVWQDKPFDFSASAGIVDVSHLAVSQDELLQAADAACKLAKEGGGNRLHVHYPDDAEQAKRSAVMNWVTKLNQALDEQRLQLRCQKIAPIGSALAESPHYEILLSMQDEEGVFIGPGEFMRAAERYNRTKAIDRWVIDSVMRWIHDNPDKMAAISGFSINLSGHSLNDENLMEYIFERFAMYRVPREKITFEVTETTAIANLIDAADFIREMKMIGCRFSLDDFGAGLSSYSYLKNLPVDYIKIDGAFIREIDHDSNDYAMVRSINEMGHYMGKKTIAEYVENEAILDKLKEIGVDYAQGFLIEKPRPLASL